MHVIVYSDHFVVANLSEVLYTRCLASGSGPFQDHGEGAHSDNTRQLTEQVLERGCQDEVSLIKVLWRVLPLRDHVSLDVDKAIILGLFRDHKLRQFLDLKELHNHLSYAFLELLIEVAGEAGQ